MRGLAALLFFSPEMPSEERLYSPQIFIALFASNQDGHHFRLYNFGPSSLQIDPYNFIDDASDISSDGCGICEVGAEELFDLCYLRF